MRLDPRTLDRALRSTLFASARTHGFAVSGGRTAWRRDPAMMLLLHVVGSRANDWVAGPTLAFHLDLGVALDAIPPLAPLTSRARFPECSFRYHLPNDEVVNHPHPRPTDEERRVWRLAGDGHDLRPVCERMAAVFRMEAMTWFGHWTDPQRLLDALLVEGPALFPGLPEGPHAAPRRLRAAAYLARALGRRELALQLFDEVLASGWEAPAGTLERLRADRHTTATLQLDLPASTARARP